METTESADGFGVTAHTILSEQAPSPDGWQGADALAVLQALPDLVLLLDAQGEVSWLGQPVEDGLGTPSDQVLGRPLTDLVHPDDRVLLAASLEGVQRTDEGSSVDVRLPDPTGTWVHHEVRSHSSLHDPQVRGVVVVLRRLDARDHGAPVLPPHPATHDPLTGLANRTLVRERLDLALVQSVTTTARVGVILCSLDGLAEVNDHHGRAIGDEVLREVGHRARCALRAEDTLGRVGADEMLAICVRDSVAEVEEAMAALTAATDRAICTAAGPVAVTLDAGCAVARGGARVEELLRRATTHRDGRRTAGHR